MNRLDVIIGKSPILKKMYDIARIVDPVEKSVIKFSDNKVVTEEFKCYDFWGNNRICDNCISMRAYNDNATYIKMEFNRDKIYLITAMPYDLDGRRVIIEFLKEVTDNLMLDKDDFASAKMKEIHNLIGKMNRMAFQDSLTGLYNRRFINEKLPADILRLALSGSSIALLMCDLDKFKDINDHYGHMVGDKALKEFSKLLKATATLNDGWAARFGGDEFLICIPGINLKEAIKAGERLRDVAGDLKIKTDGGEISLTVSIGIDIIEPISYTSVQEALRHVDEKMYIAKSKGRNRIEY